MTELGDFPAHNDDVRRVWDAYRTGRPIGQGWLPTGTDGPLTVACNVRGAGEVCEDLAEDEKYFHDLLAWVTDGICRRMRAWKELAGEKKPGPGDVWGFADDSIALLSAAAYREHVLPYHRKIAAEFQGDARTYIHLCGDAQRHFAAMYEAGKAFGRYS